MLQDVQQPLIDGLITKYNYQKNPTGATTKIEAGDLLYPPSLCSCTLKKN